VIARASAGLVAFVGLIGVGLAAGRPPRLEPLPVEGRRLDESRAGLAAGAEEWLAPLRPVPRAGGSPEPPAGVSAAPESPPAEPAAAGPALRRTSPCPEPAAEAASVAAPRGAGGVAADGRIVLNHASAAELRRLPGVGAKRAAAIVALRERLGRFRRTGDLLRVKGIGVRTLQRLTPQLLLDPPSEPAASERPAR
jgi:competence protein ComEA